MNKMTDLDALFQTATLSESDSAAHHARSIEIGASRRAGAPLLDTRNVQAVERFRQLAYHRGVSLRSITVCRLCGGNDDDASLATLTVVPETTQDSTYMLPRSFDAAGERWRVRVMRTSAD